MRIPYLTSIFSVIAVFMAPQNGFAQRSAQVTSAMQAALESPRLWTETLKDQPCKDGMAAQFPCNNVDLLAFLPIQEIGGTATTGMNDNWGWTDPTTGREYAIACRTDGTSFIEVTDPKNPVYLGNLPLHKGARANIWRDAKVYQDHVFIVADGAGSHGMQVFDLSQLRNLKAGTPPQLFQETAWYNGVASAHNIAINEDTGFAYIVGANGSAAQSSCGGGLHMVNIQNPKSPQFAGCFSDPRTGNSKTGYTHDTQCVVYKGPDTDYLGREICASSNETALSIADVSEKQAPKALSFLTYPKVGYTHQGWFTDDQRYFLVDDELDEMRGGLSGTRTLIFDLKDLDNPTLFAEYTAGVPSIDHNLYVKGRYAYLANYSSGMRVLDLKDLAKPIEAGFFDTYPQDNEVTFNGAWTAYPFFKSGTLLVTSRTEGVFLLRLALSPVQVLSFSAKGNYDSNVLTWRLENIPATLKEIQVERSRDSKTFEVIKTLPIQGETTTFDFRDVLHPDWLGTKPTYRLRFNTTQGSFNSAIAPTLYDTPKQFTLHPSFPNPFKNQNFISYSLLERDDVKITIYDALGRLVQVLVDERQSAGVYQHLFDASRLPAGVYWLELRTSLELGRQALVKL